MSETYLEDPNGAPYPPSVQSFILHHLMEEHSGYPDNDALQDLVAAIESAIAVDREHRPPAPELTDEQAMRLVNIWCSGFASGATTGVMQLAVPEPPAKQLGLYLASRMINDPAVRLELEEDARHTWATGDQRRPGWNMFTAYPTEPHNHPGEHQ